MTSDRIEHPFPPVFDDRSRILILGTLPSVKSRENAFYYGHPRNRFWKVISALLEQPVPETVQEKTALLKQNYIALWDVVQSCEIQGSSDSSIQDVVPTDLSALLQSAPIQRIFANGAKAAELYRRYQMSATGMEITTLPSTSPANAAWDMERLLDAWRVLVPIVKTPES